MNLDNFKNKLYQERQAVDAMTLNPLGFYDWLFLAPGHRSAWLVFFAFGLGFFVCLASVTQQLILLGPAAICLTTILTFGLSAAQPVKEITKTIIKEKIITIEQPKDLIPYEVIYILRRRSDGILKFGRTADLGNRIKGHRNDYKTEFDIVASWVVPYPRDYERLALNITKRYAYFENNHRELRKMTDRELRGFILSFTKELQDRFTGGK